MRRLAGVAVVVLLAVGAAHAGQLPATDGAWSDVVDGLRGRLILTPVEWDARPQLQIEIELANTRTTLGPLEIPWREPPSTIVRLSLENEAGTPVVADFIPGGNEHSVDPYVLSIPMGGSIRLTLARAPYEYLPDGRAWLRPFAFVALVVPAGASRVYLRATLEPKATGEKNRWPRLWVGPLPLPRIALPIPERVRK